ncbi:MAG: hypothetical protein WAU01_03490 [Saprospiraceae bacterium]
MTIYKEYKVGGGGSPFGFLGPLLILALFFTALFFLAKGLFWLFSWAAPVLLIITLIMDHTVVVDFFKFVWKLLSENILMGLLAVLLIVFGYPIVAGYLFFKALGKRSIKKVMDNAQREKNVYTDYEEVDEDDNFLELPELSHKSNQPTQSATNEYDDMFKK